MGSLKILRLNHQGKNYPVFAALQQGGCLCENIGWVQCSNVGIKKIIKSPVGDFEHKIPRWDFCAIGDSAIHLQPEYFLPHF